MARRKEMIWQNDFSLGAVRPEAEERDDTDLVTASLFEAENTISLTTGQIERRPGLLHLGTVASEYQFSISLGAGRIYQLHIVSNGFILFDQAEQVEVSNGSIDWLALCDYNAPAAWTDIEFWAVSAPDYSSILIGSKHFAMRALRRNDSGTWAFGVAGYTKGASTADLIPYYKPRGTGKMLIQPGPGGSVTIASDFDYFTPQHLGTWIRHNGIPVLITYRNSVRSVIGTPYGQISRTLVIVVADGSDFSIGDAVEHSTLGGTGLVTDVSGTSVTILSLGSYKDFPSSGELIGPNAKSAITTSSLAPAGAYVSLWDAQMFSPVYGYPGWGAIHKGRLYLCGYPSAPRAFAASQAGDLLNFQDGANDADAFVETVSGESGGDLKYMVSAEDLLFLTTRGLYYQPTRDGTAITPLTIAPVAFSPLGVTNVKPVAVEDGAIFVDVVGQQVFAAVLSGDAYRSWRTVQIAQYHSHLIKTPIRIGATVYGSQYAEQFVYVTNSDGTAAICQWDKDQNKISWRPWSTKGSFKSIFQAGKHIYAMVDRTFGGSTLRRRERFERRLSVDGGALINVDASNPNGGTGFYDVPNAATPANHLVGQTVQVYLEGWDFTDLVINASGQAILEGKVLVYPTDTARLLQLGHGFTVRCTPWSRRSISTNSGTRDVKRLIDLYVSVQSTGSFKVGTVGLGGYQGGDDLTVPPPLETRQYRLGVPGNASFERVPIVMERPGPFRLLKIGYKVSV